MKGLQATFAVFLLVVAGVVLFSTRKTNGSLGVRKIPKQPPINQLAIQPVDASGTQTLLPNTSIAARDAPTAGLPRPTTLFNEAVIGFERGAIKPGLTIG